MIVNNEQRVSIIRQVKQEPLISLNNFKFLRQLKGNLKGKEIFEHFALFFVFYKIIYLRNSFASKSVLNNQDNFDQTIKPVFLFAATIYQIF